MAMNFWVSLKVGNLIRWTTVYFSGWALLREVSYNTVCGHVYKQFSRSTSIGPHIEKYLVKPFHFNRFAANFCNIYIRIVEA
jgi:hypothetical protein